MKTLKTLTVGVLLAIGANGQAIAQTPLAVAATKANITALLDKNYPALDALYKDLHAHPEIAFQERRTASTLTKRLRGLGFSVTEGIGRTGIVGIYHNGLGPVVMVLPSSMRCRCRKRPALRMQALRSSR